MIKYETSFQAGLKPLARNESLNKKEMIHEIHEIKRHEAIQNISPLSHGRH